MERSYKSKRRIRRFSILVILLILLGVFHKQVLFSIGNLLIAEDPKAQTDALVVLGGSSYERGLEAQRLFDEGWSEHIICTGGNIPTVLAAIDTSLYEADITKSMLVKRGLPSSQIAALTGSTSTKEESEEVVQYCTENGLNHITVISSKFHTSRVKKVFNKAFEGTAIQVNYRGAPSAQYDEAVWWKSEAGLIMVNNEYVKHLYYLIRY